MDIQVNREEENVGLVAVNGDMIYGYPVILFHGNETILMIWQFI